MNNWFQNLLRALVALIVSLQISSVVATNSNTSNIINGHQYNLNSLAAAEQIQLRGGWEWNSQHSQAESRFNDAVIEGTFEGTHLELVARLNKQLFDFSLNNAAPTRLAAPEGDKWANLQLAENLPAGKYHFMLHLANRIGKPFQAKAFNTDGSFIAANFKARQKLLGFGSSTLDFCGVTWGAGQELSYEVINRGIGGTTVNNDGQYRVARDVLPFAPNVVLINYGSNDWMGNVPLEQFKSAYTNMLNQLGQGLPQSGFVVLGLFPRKDGNETTRSQYNTAIRAAINAAGLANRVKYVEIGSDYNWVTDTSDGTHPSPAVVKAKFLPLLVPAIISMTR